MSDLGNESDVILPPDSVQETQGTPKNLLADDASKTQEKQDVSEKQVNSATDGPPVMVDGEDGQLVSSDALDDSIPVSPNSASSKTSLETPLVSSPVNAVPDSTDQHIGKLDTLEDVASKPLPSPSSKEEVASSDPVKPADSPLIDITSCDGTEGATSSQTKLESPSLQESLHHIKWIKWKDGKAAVITQNENGPCPLIAIMNVLILQGKVQLPSMVEVITTAQLMEYLGDCILEFAPKEFSEGAQLNYEQNMHDAMAVLPKLQSGLDVNVKFTGVQDFEYTPECIIFDLLHIPLYHGWLVDPETPEIVAAVGSSSYNQLVERIITNKSSTQQDLATEAFIAKTFLERTASQLTYHGLCELNLTIPKGEVCVLFRNNHFCTLYKEKDHLYQLVTDQGFLTESSVVWETLSTIDGDGEFVDSNFVLVPPRAAAPGAVDNNPPPSSEQIVDQDYLVALSLQEEQEQVLQRERAWEEYKEKQLGLKEPLTDEELARRLNDQEQSRAQSSSHQQAQASAAPEQRHRHERHSPNQQIPSSAKKKSDCSIL